MSNKKITRAYLETLSFSDLSALADEYGIDVPENLNRRFLIGELLEIAMEDIKVEEMKISSENESEQNQSLSKNYNESQINIVLRNPAWAFVFWNISDSDADTLKKLHNYSLLLRICSLPSEDEQKPDDVFEIQAIAENQEQYILLPPGKKFIKIELVYVTPQGGKVLAFSPVLKIPEGSKYINDLQPGRDDNFTEIELLSGINKILLDQYTNHRHSFN